MKRLREINKVSSQIHRKPVLHPFKRFSSLFSFHSSSVYEAHLNEKRSRAFQSKVTVFNNVNRTYSLCCRESQRSQHMRANIRRLRHWQQSFQEWKGSWFYVSTLPLKAINKDCRAASLQRRLGFYAFIQLKGKVTVRNSLVKYDPLVSRRSEEQKPQHEARFSFRNHFLLWFSQ